MFQFHNQFLPHLPHLGQFLPLPANLPLFLHLLLSPSPSPRLHLGLQGQVWSRT